MINIINQSTIINGVHNVSASQAERYVHTEVEGTMKKWENQPEGQPK
jgi:hypothetical protein